MSILELCKVGKKFNKINVLKSVDIVVDRSQIYSFVGASGSGKTTLIEIAGLMSKPDEGKVLFCGDLNFDYDEVRKNNVGFVYQQHHLFSELNVIQNVMLQAKMLYSNKIAYKKSEYSLDLLGISSLKHESISSLSVGQKQKVSISRAIVKKPMLICADEPTGSIDSEGAKNIFALFQGIKEEMGTSVLVVTHDQALAKIYSDKIFLIKDGGCKQI